MRSQKQLVKAVLERRLGVKATAACFGLSTSRRPRGAGYRDLGRAACRTLFASVTDATVSAERVVRVEFRPGDWTQSGYRQAHPGLKLNKSGMLEPKIRVGHMTIRANKNSNVFRMRLDSEECAVHALLTYVAHSTSIYPSRLRPFASILLA
jgi:hypothetical protein